MGCGPQSTKGSLTPHGSGRGPPLPSRGVSVPRDVVVVLLDSLNRHLLGSYGGTEFDTPNLDRLAARSVRFTNHHTGSLPCMPARHDLLVGALDFPWRPWGSIEVWEDAVTHLLRREAGISTMLVSDHPHLFETGGENYHTDFGAWDYLRGHEDDPWRTRPDPSFDRRARPPRAHGRTGSTPTTAPAPGSATRTTSPVPARWRRPPAGSTASCAPNAVPRSGRCSWSTSSTRTSPSTCPSRGPAATTRTGRASASSGRRTRESQEQSGLSDRESVHLRAQYGAKLSMIDHWLGRILDVVDRAPGVGHHGLHPLHRPRPLPRRARVLGQAPGARAPRARPHPAAGLVARRGARPPTAPSPPPSTCTPRSATSSPSPPSTAPTASRSCPLLEGTATSIREWALCGVWGREVHVADATRTFAKAPVDENRPMSMFSNRWTTMPIRALPATGCPSRTTGRGSTTLPGTRRAGDPAALRPERRPPVLGGRPLRRRRALRPRARPTPPARSATRPAAIRTRRWPTSSWRRCARSRRPTEQLVRLGPVADACSGRRFAPSALRRCLSATGEAGSPPACR